MFVNLVSTLLIIKKISFYTGFKFGQIFSSNKFLFIATAALVISFLIQCIFEPNNAFWAMNNDAVWNTVSARFLLADGGVDVNVHPNPSPLTAGVLAAATGPGRELISNVFLLSHDISRQAQAWSAVVIISCFVSGAIAVISLKSVSGLTRGFAVLSAFALPLTWFYIGNAVSFGFYNASLATLVLLTIWATWLVHESNVAYSILAFCLSAIVLLSTWAPLVLIPAFFIIILLVRHYKILLKRSLESAISAIGLLGLSFYAVFVTLKDFSRDGGSLGVDGGIFDFAPAQFGLIVLSAFIISLFTAGSRGKNLYSTGVTVLVAASLVGVTFLSYQRRNAESMWGYYPVKFAWLISTLLLVIIFVGLILFLSRVSFSWFYKSIFLISSGGFVVLLMALSGLVAPKNFLTPIGIMTDPDIVQKNHFVQVLSRLSEVGHKNFVANYSDTAEEDLAINSWLLQINSNSSQDPIRWFSYYLDGSDISMVCEASQTWGEGVTIYTRNPFLRETISQSCPSISVEVSLHD